jgi:hypothetical protein
LKLTFEPTEESEEIVVERVSIAVEEAEAEVVTGREMLEVAK